jgi:hypothetical protein
MKQSGRLIFTPHYDIVLLLLLMEVWTVGENYAIIIRN